MTGLKASRRALVVLSGGQDSTTCLFLARVLFDEIFTITFDYGQRHRVELDAAAEIARLAGSREHRLVDLRGYGALATSALTGAEQGVMEHRADGLPSTFVPGRNLAFLVVASSYAVVNGIHDILTGVCQTDFSGYPDCREDTIRALEHAVNLGIGASEPVRIHTPLMWMTKAETVRMARKLPGCWEALARSITCYQGKVPGCGECPSCLLRAKGFREACEQDPAST